MGYFPNGTAGACFEEQHCARCAHNDEDSGCPIWNAHLLYNYDQLSPGPKGEGLKAVLDMLIVDKGAAGDECVMFIEDPKAAEKQAERRRLAEQREKYEAIMAERRAAA